jgi:hypothetical protein
LKLKRKANNRALLFKEREKKEEKRNDHWRQTTHQPLSRAAPGEKG